VASYHHGGLGNLKGTLMVVALVLSQASDLSAQNCQFVSFVQPEYLSACANDTITLCLTNCVGTKSPTSGTGTITVNMPGTGQVQYATGTVTSIPAGATSSSPTGGVVVIDVPLPAFGDTTKIKFVVQSSCDVDQLSLPQFTGNISFSPGFPAATQNFSSGFMNVGKPALSAYFLPGWQNLNLYFGYDYWQSIHDITNGGYGNVDKIKITVISDNDFGYANSGLRDVIYNYNSSVSYGSLVPISTTVGPEYTTYVYEAKGSLLGPDGLLTPGETIRLYNGPTPLS